MNGLLCKNPKNLVNVSEQEYKNSLLRATPLQMLRDARHPDWSGEEEELWRMLPKRSDSAAVCQRESAVGQ
ncbi:MAG: hypothetical protein ACI30J_01840 [Paludibacteraceae bacterium]